eukprot:gnl/TRDRNA2_/TRDRNA2_162107_c3_seq1.p1 gnl/TRDRNA2_/TRDRNA2_162107_c3~~gnl/TRDRNA2_/TRDRNA2_162107_c3_seq1.p1  ORF type:complete len:431 (-),score=55.14 gnl/TRDRNA2_/TRDRNA2_162107_c3_seq1:34-1326(-)
MLTFMKCRSRKTTRSLDARNRANDSIVDKINSTVRDYRLIADFNKRGWVVERFEKTIAEYNKSLAVLGKVMSNNNFFATMLTNCMVAFYALIGGQNVINGKLTLGMFLTNIRVLGSIGSSCGNIYMILQEIQSVFPALLRVTRLLNLTSDVPKRGSMAHANAEESVKLRKDIRAEMDAIGGTVKDLPAIDFLPVLLSDIRLQFGKKELHFANTFKVCQGTLVGVLGKRGEGKSSLLKIFGGEILPPTDGPSNLFVPSHVRVLHVSHDIMFIVGTLIENLTFGCSKGDGDAREERVIQICEKLNLPQSIAQHIKSGEIHPWKEMVSSSQAALLSLIRAFVANPEVMILHKPTVSFEEVTSHKVFSILREYVLEKGLEQNRKEWGNRRPRTCVFSTNRTPQVKKFADVAFVITQHRGIQKVPLDDLDDDMIA